MRPDQAQQQKAPVGLDPVVVEFLARLVARGEALLHPSCTFPAAQTLLRLGFAEVAATYVIQGVELSLIKPTASGVDRVRLAAAERVRDALSPAA